MEPLRILHVTPYYEHAWGYGGIPRVAANLCRALARRGHQVTICTTDACDARSRLATSGPDTTSDGVEVRVFRNVSNRLAYNWQLFTPRGLLRHARQHAADFHVAHIHGHHHLPGVLSASALREAGVPYLVAPNGTAPRIERRRAAKWLFDQSFGRSVLPGAAQAVAVTRAERVQLLQLGIPEDRISILPNSLDLEEFSEPIARADLRALFARRPDRIVLYLGKLTPRKGLDVLLHAFRRIATPSVGLVIAGNDMGMASSLHRIVSNLGLGDSVRFAGQQRGRERLEMLSGADAVAYPGSDEIFGLVPLEAILCGSPVVVANDSGCGEIIGQVGGGRVVEARNPAALARALDALIAEGGDAAHDLEAAQRQVASQFGSDDVAARFEALYRELTSRKAEA